MYMDLCKCLNACTILYTVCLCIYVYPASVFIPRCDGSRADFEPPCFTILLIPGFECIRFARSAAECQLENGRITTRQQININTAFIDGSQVYGSTDILARELRDLTSKYCI